jgi:hypothetical protein
MPFVSAEKLSNNEFAAVLETLEHWTVVQEASGTYQSHTPGQDGCLTISFAEQRR